jgi:cyclic pyranopterin phosphate synthase
MLKDTHNRVINYLRLSVTDRCNLRCKYCVPQKAQAGMGRRDLLSYDDLLRLARESVALGIRKIRITGGEPLVRPGIVEFLERIHDLSAHCHGESLQLVLTTNGMLLKKLAAPLRRAGVRRLNISLDSLKKGTFASITGGGNVDAVLDGIEATMEAGFPPPQINVVVLRGLNDSEIPAFAALAAKMQLNVRFIEYMPITGNSGWRSQYVPSSEVLERIGREHRLTPVESLNGAGPARYFQLDGGPAQIGVISPISEHFCASCNRIRIASDGLARGCLFADEATDLKPYLKQGDEAVRAILTSIIRKKPLRHSVTESECWHSRGWVPMSAIGG